MATSKKHPKKLSAEQLRVMAGKGTESPFSSPLLHNKTRGDYACAACGAKLFSSHAKFDSGTGWPSFDEPANAENVELRPDASHGMARTEVVCNKCGGHLVHVFDDGPTNSGKRFCINGCALDFKHSK